MDIQELRSKVENSGDYSDDEDSKYYNVKEGNSDWEVKEGSDEGFKDEPAYTDYDEDSTWEGSFNDVENYKNMDGSADSEINERGHEDDTLDSSDDEDYNKEGSYIDLEEYNDNGNYDFDKLYI